MTRRVLGALLAGGLALLAGCGGTSAVGGAGAGQPAPPQPGGAPTVRALSAQQVNALMVRLQRERFGERQFFVAIVSASDLQAARRQGFAAILRQLTWLPPGAWAQLEGQCRVERPTTDDQGQTHVLAALERDRVAAGLKLAGGSLTAAQVTAALGGRAEGAVKNGRRVAAYLVLGLARARFEGSEMGQSFAMARGRLRIIETATGRTLAELKTDEIKGGHIARKKACRKAMDNVVARLQPLLERRLRAGLR